MARRLVGRAVLREFRSEKRHIPDYVPCGPGVSEKEPNDRLTSVCSHRSAANGSIELKTIMSDNQVGRFHSVLAGREMSLTLRSVSRSIIRYCANSLHNLDQHPGGTTPSMAILLDGRECVFGLLIAPTTRVAKPIGAFFPKAMSAQWAL